MKGELVMTLAGILEQMSIQLQKLAEIDFGYPLGNNAIRPPSGFASLPPGNSMRRDCVAKWLISLYSACDGFSFPDVHVGYFIKPFARVESFDLSSEPVIVVLDVEIPVISIGSTGGGSLFVVNCETGAVMLLPPGPLNHGRYDGRTTNVKVLSNSILEFLALLLGDLTAFVDDDADHVYLANS